jgi:peptide/nickel transport system substrate-binding protein
MRKSWIVTAVLLLALLMAACGGGAAPAPADVAPAEEAAADAAEAPAADAPAAEAAEAPAASGETALEAPALADMVAAGDLPPLAERLPAEPKVIGPGVLLSEANVPNWAPGRYGGTLNSSHSVADWAPDVFVMLNEPLLQAPGERPGSVRSQRG